MSFLSNFLPKLDDDMSTLVNHCVSKEDLETYESAYEAQLAAEKIDIDVKLHYAWSLMHTPHPSNVKKAITLLEEIFKDGSDQLKRDSLFFLALAETKQKNYCTAKKYVDSFLSVEPLNEQAQQLQVYIDKSLKKDGITGMALVGAAAVFGGLTAIALGAMAIGSAAGFAFKWKKK